MKRTPLIRKTPLRQSSTLQRRTRLKVRGATPARRRLVADILANQTVCGFPGCNERPTQVHEILPRGRGGNPEDPDVTVGLCQKCHTFLHAHPIEANRLGLLRHSWEKS